MEAIFRPSKWFVIFCGILVATWGILQYVSNLRLEREAEGVGARVFTWFWPGDNWLSEARITSASIERRTETDAIVKVKGKQVLTFFARGQDRNDKTARSETVDCSATLTFYRLSNNWVLGKVELP